MTAAQAAAAHRLTQPLGGLYAVGLAARALVHPLLREGINTKQLARDLEQVERDVRILTGETSAPDPR